jgi:uncharacterized protein DUF4157
MEKQTKHTSDTAPVVNSIRGETAATSSGLAGTIIGLQHAIGNQAVLGLLNTRFDSSGSTNSEGATTPSARAISNLPGIDSAGKSLSASPLAIQRSPNGRDTEAASGAGSAVPAAPDKSKAGGLIVENNATVGPRQMRKRDFLARLRTSVCDTANEALKQSGRTANGCPYVDKWLSYYAEQDPAHIERALRKYAPETTSATSAEEYIPAVSNRVRRAVDTWLRTGEITGVPDELKGLLPGGGSVASLEGLIGMGLQAVVGGIGSLLSAAAGAIGGFFSDVGQMLFKRNDSGNGAAGDPQQAKSQLVGGQQLEGGVRSRMGAAFGKDFSSVRIHTGSHAAALSEQMNARAFAVGSDIAFAQGEYRPGTPVGDALIAHELAHVAQQHGSVQTAERNSAPESHTLESEADDAAVDAVIAIWGTKGSAVGRIGGSRAGLKTGLRLQRCGPDTSDPALLSYLSQLEGEDKIQGGTYDDNRARAVVSRWKQSATKFDLKPHVKYLLIQEMLDGSTGEDDQRAILDLLELSDNGDLRIIFGRDHLSPTELDKKIDDNRDELRAFFEERFDGGRAALIKGKILPKGSPKKGAPLFAYSWVRLEERLKIPYLAADIVEYVKSLPLAEQVKARTDLNTHRAENQKKQDELLRIINDKMTAAAKAANVTVDKLPKDKVFDVAPNEMLAARKIFGVVERMESVLYALTLETAKGGVAKAEQQAVVPATEAEKTAAKGTLTPPTTTNAQGQVVGFTDKAGYEAELRTATKNLINVYHKAFVEDVNRASLYPLPRLAEIANAGRQAVEDVFKDFRGPGTGAEFTPNVNLVDLFVEIDSAIQSLPEPSRTASIKANARSKVLSMMAAERDLRAVNKKFSVNPDFDETGAPKNDEAVIQVKIADEIAATDAQRVFEIIRGWPGAHREGRVKLQTTKQPAGPKERAHFWKLYQTSIHEYIHSLMNGDYRRYAQSFPGKDKSREHNTLVEGVATVLHETVWESVKSKLSTPAIRDKVEGPDYAKLPFDESVIPDITQIRYGSYEEAQALIARVGIANVLLAFFRGRVDLIGGNP